MPHVMGGDYERCLNPLTDEPTGSDPKRDETFVDLKGEIENIASGKVSWERVEELAINVLAEISKDLYTMSYLSAALLQRHGFAGLADAFALLRHWMETDWDNLYPRRPARSRGFAFGWLVERVTPYISARQPMPEEIALLQPLQDDLQVIATIARDQLKHLAPGFGEMHNALRRLIEENPVGAAAGQGADDSSSPADAGTGDGSATDTTGDAAVEGTATQGTASATLSKAAASKAAASKAAESEATPSKTAASKTPSPDAAPAQAPAPTPAPAGAKAVEIPELPPLADNATSRDIRDRIRALIAPLRQSQVLSPTPYQMLRTLKWRDLSGAPPADPDSGKTRLPAPRNNQRLVLANLLENKSWPELLEASEAAFQNDVGTFWLDLQHYSAVALENLDASHGPSLAALIVDELATLLQRFSNMPRLTFQDGTAFASPTTRQWIEESVRTVEVEVVSFGDRGEDTVLTEDDISQIQKAFDSKQPEAAMAQLDTAIRRASNPRAVFRTRLTAAQLCLQANKDGWARMLLDDLRQSMERFSFEGWEPEVSTELYHLLALCCVRQIEKAGETPDPALQETLDLAQSRLFSLDLRAGAKVEAAFKDSAALASGGKGRTGQVAELAQLFKHLLGRS